MERRPGSDDESEGSSSQSLSGADQLDQQIATLSSLGVADLRKAWAERFRRPAPPIQSADLLLRLFAWKLQVTSFGDLDADTPSKLARLKTALTRGKSTAPSPALGLRPGSILSREWRGQVHRVLVLDQGFEHLNVRYRSLSEVARAITGTRWSGPRFFGLEAEQARPARVSEEVAS
ncbi:MAG: DUF2924 domain-containing protein [Parvibaculum sp.]|nr:DUF2924 domain-containing protein [Parvibaculum sp.]